MYCLRYWARYVRKGEVKSGGIKIGNYYCNCTNTTIYIVTRKIYNSQCRRQVRKPHGDGIRNFGIGDIKVENVSLSLDPLGSPFISSKYATVEMHFIIFAIHCSLMPSFCITFSPKERNILLHHKLYACIIWVSCHCSSPLFIMHVIDGLQGHINIIVIRPPIKLIQMITTKTIVKKKRLWEELIFNSLPPLGLTIKLYTI